MRTDHYNAVIIGSGCAGVAAASRLAGTNLNVLMIDENIHPGGQYLKTIPSKLGTQTILTSEKTKTVGQQIIQYILNKEIKTINRAEVLGIYPGNELLIEEENNPAYIVKAEIILIATGAREKFLPFKGWTLPGVISAGAAQIMMKTSGILPRKKTVIGGSGLFLYRVAHDYITCGGHLLSLVDRTSLLQKLSGTTHLLRQVPKLVESTRFLKKIYSSRADVRHRTKIIEARGAKHLEEVVTAEIDQRGKIQANTERVHQTNGLAISHGFTPNIELPLQAGCSVAFDHKRGGWYVQVNDAGETSIPGIYAAGETTGIGGAEKAMVEGELAALSILHKFDQISGADLADRQSRLGRTRKRHLEFAAYFNSLCEITNEDILQIPADTIICRCEGQKMSDIKQAVSNGCTTPAALKRATRIGMGTCQGRTCGPVLYQVLSVLSGKPMDEVKPLSVRIPVKALSVRSVIGD